jgi:hypothetical protein
MHPAALNVFVFIYLCKKKYKNYNIITVTLELLHILKGMDPVVLIAIFL